MSELFDNLKRLGDDLEAEGLPKSAAVVTSAMKEMLVIKQAQYEGVQGYWIRNRRCWDNCYRQGRAHNPDKPAQEVWTTCHEEYLASINNDKSGWEKYASDKPLTKTASNEPVFKKEAASIRGLIESKIKDGMPVPNAVYETYETSPERYLEATLDQANRLLKISENLNKHGKSDLAVRVGEASLELLKESQWWQNLKGMGNQFFNRMQGDVGGGHGGYARNFNAASLKQMISQLGNTLQGYKTQKQKLVGKLQQVAGQGSGVAQDIAVQMMRLMRGVLNDDKLQQMNALADQMSQQEGQGGVEGVDIEQQQRDQEMFQSEQGARTPESEPASADSLGVNAVRDMISSGRLDPQQMSKAIEFLRQEIGKGQFASSKGSIKTAMPPRPKAPGVVPPVKPRRTRRARKPVAPPAASAGPTLTDVGNVNVPADTPTPFGQQGNVVGPPAGSVVPAAMGAAPAIPEASPQVPQAPQVPAAPAPVPAAPTEDLAATNPIASMVQQGEIGPGDLQAVLQLLEQELEQINVNSNAKRQMEKVA